MTRRSKTWLVVGVIFTSVNGGGLVLAAVQGELLHACAHAGLLLGAYFVWRLAPSRYTGRIGRRAEAMIPAPGELTDRLTQLEQSLGAVAIEIERIGEGQRFMTRLFTEKGTPQMTATTSPEFHEGQ